MIIEVNYCFFKICVVFWPVVNFLDLFEINRIFTFLRILSIFEKLENSKKTGKF